MRSHVLYRHLAASALAVNATVFGLGSGASFAADTSAVTVSSSAASELEVTLWVVDDRTRYRTLRCDPDSGEYYLINPTAACDQLRELFAQGRDPFAPVPAGQYCPPTHIYDEDESAWVTGTWRGRHVEAHFKHGTTCQNDRFDAIGKVLHGY